MDDEKKAGVNQSGPNGESFTEPELQDSDPGEDVRRRQLDELTHAYERARNEMNDALRSLRAEIAKIDIEQARARARTWVDENPTLAVFLGIGAGILAGRLMSTAFRSEPPPVSSRARRQADRLVGRAGDYADELGTALAYYLGRAARTAGEAGEIVADRGEEVADAISRRALDIGEDVSRRAERTGRDFVRRAGHVGQGVARRAEHAADTIVDSTSRSVHALEEATQDLSKNLKKRSKTVAKEARKGVDSDLAETALNAARTVVAAAAVKKVNDWIKKMR